MLWRCYLSTFQTFFFLSVNELYIGIIHQFSPPGLNTATPHFYPFQFSGIKYLPPGLCAGVWIWPNTLLQRRRAWKKYSWAEIQWSKYILESIEKYSWEIQWSKYILESIEEQRQKAVIWNRDNVSPLEFCRGRFFLFVRVDFFQTAPVDDWQERRLMSKFAPSSIFPSCISNRN